MNLEHLRLESELQRVLGRYAELCDERDWTLIDQVFSADATASYGGWALADRAAILKMLRDNLGGCGPTQHLLGNLAVEADAQGVSSRISVRAAHRGAGEKKLDTYECMGYYHDRWVRTAEGWRIQHRTMVVKLEFGSRKLLGQASVPD